MRIAQIYQHSYVPGTPLLKDLVEMMVEADLKLVEHKAHIQNLKQ